MPINWSPDQEYGKRTRGAGGMDGREVGTNISGQAPVAEGGGGEKGRERTEKGGRESEGRKVPPIIQEVPGRSPFSVLSAPNTSEMVVGGWEASGRGRLLSTTRAPTVID